MDLDDDELKATREFYEKKRKQKLDKDKEELRKYDIRKIELKNGEIEKAPSFTKREIELMNLGIILYCNS